MILIRQRNWDTCNDDIKTVGYDMVVVTPMKKAAATSVLSHRRKQSQTSHPQKWQDEVVGTDNVGMRHCHPG